MEVTGVAWHPIDKNTVLTSSLDGSLRIWDLLGESTFGNLCSKHVLKIRGVTGQNRVGATSCCYTPNGEWVTERERGNADLIWPDLWHDLTVLYFVYWTIRFFTYWIYIPHTLLNFLLHPPYLYSSTGLRMIGGANDGSIHIWQERKSYSKPDLLIRLAHTVGSLVTCVTVSPNGYV